MNAKQSDWNSLKAKISEKLLSISACSFIPR